MSVIGQDWTQLDTVGRMQYVTAQTRSLGDHMSERRKRLALSQSRAAKLAGVSRTSWITWERDTATPEDYNHIKIERALDWEPGSVESIQAGREPTLAEAPDLDDPGKEILRTAFEELSHEYGEKRARKMIDEVLAERGPGSVQELERGAG
jgi:DNA-binding XRE family transcriptional regulator